MEMMTEEKRNEKYSRHKLYFSVFVLDLVFFASACAFAWSSPILPKIMVSTTQLNSTQFTVNSDEASWIVSLLSLGNILGPFIAGFLLDIIGRRWTIFLDVSCKIFSWILISQTFSIYMIYFGRFIVGIANGISFSSLSLYIAEISEDSVRGALNNLMQFFISLAVLLTFTIGSFVSYNDLILFCCMPCILFLILFPWLPESPYYLISKKKNKSARAVLEWLRGDGRQSSIEREMGIIMAEISESKSRNRKFTDLIFHPGTFRALMITSGLLALQQFTGIGVVVLYAETIFEMTGSSVSSYYCTIIVGVVMLLSGACCPFIVSRFGYKSPLVLSGIGMAISHGLLAIYLALFFRNFEVVILNWIPVFSVNMYIVFATIGFSTIPWALMGELFSSDMKSIGAAVDTSICAFFTFALANIFPNVAVSLGLDTVFLTFSLFSIISVFFVIYLVPNTNGMSLADIQQLMNNAKRNDK